MQRFFITAVNEKIKMLVHVFSNISMRLYLIAHKPEDAVRCDFLAVVHNTDTENIDV